jgi:hypothetical protein
VLTRGLDSGKKPGAGWDTSDQRTKADHCLVVTGVDTNEEIVHLNDPGADHANEQVSIATFMKAWKNREELIIVSGLG